MRHTYALNSEKLLRMPSRCIFAGCSNTVQPKLVCMHVFPINPAVRKIWTAKVKFTRGKWHVPTASSVIYSTHFDNNLYDTGLYSQFGTNKLKRLKVDAIPTKIRDDSNRMEKKKMDRAVAEKYEKLRVSNFFFLLRGVFYPTGSKA